jgi:lactate dehydrogenase-like 2-hydroxyacid dehydrogenase
MVKAWQDLSVLIVGCGSIGKRHARVLHGLGVGDLRCRRRCRRCARTTITPPGWRTAPTSC